MSSSLPVFDPGSIQDTISGSMLHNSGVFLRRAAEEIVSRNRKKNRTFDIDRAMLVTVLIQTAVELASTALVIRHDGLAAVMRRDIPQDDKEVEDRWRAGEIRTRTFEEIKGRAMEIFGDESFWLLVDDFQMLRNKLVHFHRPLEDDVFDLQYDTTHILIQMISTLTENGDEYDLPNGSISFLGQKLFDKLMAFEPYRYRIEQLARRADSNTLRCVMCNIEAYSPTAEKCLACGFEGSLQLLRCPRCKKRALYYDHLNLPINPSLTGLCGACGYKAHTAHCPICSVDYAFDPTASVCCPWIDQHE